MNRTRRKVPWLAGITLIVLCLVALRAWSGHEPSYGGHALSQSLEGLDNASAVTNTATITALRTMEAKAAVRLVPMLEASDSPYKLWAVDLLRKQPFFNVPLTPAAVKQHRAERAFEIMGEKHWPRLPRWLPC
jgi:hypothetical protein